MEDVQAVQTMQEYIKQYSTAIDFSIEKVCQAVGYSRRHADRLFKKHTGKTVREYILAVQLTQSSVALQNTKKSIVDIALNSHFQTHEGFTRSFKKNFHTTPSKYREQGPPISRFTQHPIAHYYILLRRRRENTMEHTANTENHANYIMVTPQERPKRILIYLPSISAHDYLSYCEEMGCEWEGFLNSIAEKFDTAALLTLPEFLVENGNSPVAAGLEVPLDYDKKLPPPYKTAVLEKCTMLYFQSPPYLRAEDFAKAITTTSLAAENFPPERYGYALAYDKAPRFNFGAEPATGARAALPVVRLP